MTPNRSQISQWLARERERAELTRRAVSDSLGVTERAIQRWEDASDTPLPPADKFLALVVLYGADVRTLLNGEPSKRLRGPPLPTSALVALATVPSKKKKRAAGGKG